MKVVLTGVETKNKGAELMLYAILQEIERKDTNAIVYISEDRLFHPIKSILTNIDFRVLPLDGFERKIKLPAIFRYLNIPYRFLPHYMLIGKIDYVLDGSGFKFSDTLGFSFSFVKKLKFQLAAYQHKRAKIVYLPQAFGPFEKPVSQKALSVLNKYTSLLFPRELISYNYLKDTGLVNLDKVKVYTDFTSLVDGRFPDGYERLKGGICIIPNMRMIDKKMISYDGYVKLLSVIIREGRKTGRPVYLLNHEGKKDENLCYQCQSSIGGDIDVVTNLNALEVKGLISSSYLVITSRFHGLASALNTCVPCLATSWSHKYEELYHDYNLNGYVLPVDNLDEVVNRLIKLLDEKENLRIRKHLSVQHPHIKKQTQEMWHTIWSL